MERQPQGPGRTQAWAPKGAGLPSTQAGSEGVKWEGTGLVWRPRSAMAAFPLCAAFPEWFGVLGRILTGGTRDKRAGSHSQEEEDPVGLPHTDPVELSTPPSGCPGLSHQTSMCNTNLFITNLGLHGVFLIKNI